MTRGVVSNIEKTVQSIKAAVLEAQSKVKGELVVRVVNVGIAGQHISSLQHRHVNAQKFGYRNLYENDIDALIEDMYKLVVQPGEEIIHVLPQEYIVDRGTRD